MKVRRRGVEKHGINWEDQDHRDWSIMIVVLAAGFGFGRLRLKVKSNGIPIARLL